MGKGCVSYTCLSFEYCKVCKLHVLHIKLSFTLKGDVSDLTHSSKTGPVGPLYSEQSLKHIKMRFWTYFDLIFLTGALPHFLGGIGSPPSKILKFFQDV